MRTITEFMLHRLSAQAEEAKVLGFKKVADNLEHQVSSVQARTNDSEYSYAHQEMEQDVQKLLWTAAVRVADYLGAGFDAKTAQDSIDKLAEDLIHEIRINAGVKHGVGAYEPNVPGEQKETVIIEVAVDN